jgi:hypothetical protein
MTPDVVETKNMVRKCISNNDTRTHTHTLVVGTKQTKLNSMVSVRERTIPTERPSLVGEVIANFLQIEGTTWSA